MVTMVGINDIEYRSNISYDTPLSSIPFIYLNNMPTLKFLNVHDANNSMLCENNNTLTFTFEITGGEILETDEIQLCTRQLYTNPYRRRPRRYRLRWCAKSYIKDCDIKWSINRGKILTFTVPFNTPASKCEYSLLHNGARVQYCAPSNIYFRIRRARGDNNVQFSNVIAVPKKSFYNSSAGKYSIHFYI